jgi:hypothetical protein
LHDRANGFAANLKQVKERLGCCVEFSISGDFGVVCLVVASKFDLTSYGSREWRMHKPAFEQYVVLFQSLLLQQFP